MCWHCEALVVVYVMSRLSIVCLCCSVSASQFTPEELAESDRLGAERAEAVKSAMLHAWSGYRERGWGTDEMRPKSGAGRATWGGAFRDGSRCLTCPCVRVSAQCGCVGLHL